MIPRTYPSQLNSTTGHREMTVKFLTSTTGLTRWTDYVPVAFIQQAGLKENNYDKQGYISVVTPSAGYTGLLAGKDFINVYVESYVEANAWQASATGFIPIAYGGSSDVSSLFANNEQGGWWDPSDFSTMYQDSAGTTPVTAVGQPVGLHLDKRLGAVRGAELIANGGFDSDTVWAKGAGWSIASGVASKAAGVASGLSQEAGAAGTFHEISFTVSGVTAGSMDVYSGGTLVASVSANGTYTRIIQKGTSNNLIVDFYTSATFVGSVDNVSVKPIPGNHRTQATAASRPTLSARYNLLTYSQDVSNAAWTKSNVTTPDASTITDDATNGQHLIYQSPTMPAANVTGVAEVKQGTLRYVQVLLADANASARRYGVIVDTATGTVTSSSTTNAPTNTSVAVAATSDGYYRVTLKMDATTAGATFLIVGGSNSATPTYSATAAATYAGSGQSFNVRNLDLRTSADAALSIPSYQRVTTASDYDTVGFPHYLSYDGTDDSMATGSVDFSATDKVTVWAGVNKQSDAASAVFIETTSGVSGLFAMYIPSGVAGAGFRSKGSAVSDANLGTAWDAPNSGVLTGQGNISADSVSIRLNGVQSGSSVSDQGTGNYPNTVIYFGRRDGSSLPFNGREYQTIIRGAETNATLLARAESFIAARMGVTL